MLRLDPTRPDPTRIPISISINISINTSITINERTRAVMPSPAHARKPRAPRPNPLEKEGITYIDYKDTDLLRRFISDRGKICSRAASPA